MTTIIVLAAAVVLLAGLIQAEKTERAGRILIFKAPLSVLFIVAWTLQPVQHPFFAGMILIALLLCLGGDILLAFGDRKTFLFGLVSFLAGHVVYAAAFFSIGTAGMFMTPGVIVLVGSAFFIWRWLSPHLGTMQKPVLAYIVVISIMVAGALSIAGTTAIPVWTRICVLGGALLFYLSDIFVARQRFVVSSHINRLAGLPLYYTAQFLLAFSAAWIPG